MPGRKRVTPFAASLLLLVSIINLALLAQLPVQVTGVDGLFERPLADPPLNPGGREAPSSDHTLFFPAIAVDSTTLGHQQPLPYLQLAPMTHLDVVPEGLQLVAYGSDFCTEPGCSPVSIEVGDRIAVRDIQLGELGTFQVPLIVPELVGDYQVTARQTLADGTVLD